ncbi:DNA adenine methylase [Halosimplex amylolyticum]|uniref:DNA adenine methylase n=1 Tax=Halosimplex amylolyticum TaxID=3396616 RepID=UPI003F549609
MAQPVLKWAGGKRQLLDALYARFPASFDRYHEPFFGGGAVFFDLEPAAASVNDTNPRLVNFYEQVRDRPEALIERLREFRDPESDPDPELAFAAETRRGDAVEQYYYQQRARFNERAYGEDWPESDDDRLEEAALLLYLNRTCYNGLYRENSDGGFNVPIGRYADPDWVQAERIREAARALRGTEVRNGDFGYVLDAADPGDLVYFDPPYEPMSPTADFAEYSAEGFGRADQERLLEVARELDERGVSVVLSNSGVTYDRYDEAGFSVEREGATRAINSDASSRGEVDEIVATNVPSGERHGPDQSSLGEF